jgi:hypothetical protein
MLKVLSDDWSGHNIGVMYQAVSGKPPASPELMEELKVALVLHQALILG